MEMVIEMVEINGSRLKKLMEMVEDVEENAQRVVDCCLTSNSVATSSWLLLRA